MEQWRKTPATTLALAARARVVRGLEVPWAAPVATRPATPASTAHTSTFGAILDGWVVAANSTPATLAPIPGPDGGTASGTIVEIDTTDGMPATPPVGSVKLTIPFDGPNETLLFAQNMNSLNMAGETVTAYIKLNSGLNTGPVNVGTASIALKTTGAYNYVQGPVVALDPSLGWQMLSIDVSTPPAPPLGYDPCDVREIDILIQTGGSGTYTTGVVHIDSIAIGGPGVVVDDGGTPDTGPAEPARPPIPARRSTRPSTCRPALTPQRTAMRRRSTARPIKPLFR